MATSEDLKRIALDLDGTVEYPHFDRTAFKVVRTYVTLAADGVSANVKLTPDQQAFKRMLAPEVFFPIPNAWGRQGWTRIELARIDTTELRTTLETAWALGAAKKASRKATKPKAGTATRR